VSVTEQTFSQHESGGGGDNVHEIAYVTRMISYVFLAVLRIRDVYPGSGSDHFWYPGSRIRIRPSFIPDPDPGPGSYK
jgi:hypothetical protein